MNKGQKSALDQLELDNLNDEDVIQERSISSRNKLRDAVESDIEAFLKSGGVVTEVPQGLRADPPKKPTSNYGSRPI